MPVLVDREIYDHFKYYAAQTGVTVTQAIREALSDWYETVAETRIEAVTSASFSDIKQLKDNILQFPIVTSVN